MKVVMKNSCWSSMYKTKCGDSINNVFFEKEKGQYVNIKLYICTLIIGYKRTFCNQQ